MAACGREAVAPLRQGGLHCRCGRKAFGKVSKENAPRDSALPKAPMSEGNVDLPATGPLAVQSAGRRLVLHRFRHELRRLRSEVHGACACAASALDHADEEQIIGRVDPEPGAGDAEPGERAFALR